MVNRKYADALLNAVGSHGLSIAALAERAAHEHPLQLGERTLHARRAALGHGAAQRAAAVVGVASRLRPLRATERRATEFSGQSVHDADRDALRGCAPFVAHSPFFVRTCRKPVETVECLSKTERQESHVRMRP